jgi:hypothetical protein
MLATVFVPWKADVEEITKKGEITKKEHVD